MKASEKFAGWKLCEAIRRTGSPDNLRDYVSALRAYRSARGDGGISGPLPYMLGRQDFVPDVRTRELVVRSEALTLREAELRHGLLDLLKQNRLVAYGRPESLIADQKKIPPTAWEGLGIKSYKGSLITEKTESKTEIVDVRVFPVVDSVDAVDLLAGLTLLEAFERHVFNSPQRVALVARAREGGGTPMAVTFQEKLHGAFWPVRFGIESSSKLAQLLMAQPYRHLPERTRLACLAADRLLKRQFGRLIEYLAGGRLVAHGLSPSSGLVTPIPRALWVGDPIYLDLHSGNLLEYIPQEMPDAREPYRRLLLGLSLAKPDAPGPTFHVKPIVPDPVPSTTMRPAPSTTKPTGTSLVQARSHAEQACREWLTTLMQESPKVRRREKDDLWREAQTRWPKLTERGYEKARKDAMSQTGALSWGSGGAPRKRKSPHETV